MGGAVDTIFSVLEYSTENISQAVSVIFSLIIASQMHLTRALLVNGFGSPRKLTKMTPQMHLGQNDG